jgi:nicotinate-nucleotide pyrophosphorylase (carboxylating)
VQAERDKTWGIWNMLAEFSKPNTDTRDLIFKDILNKRVKAKIWSTQGGVIAGINRMVKKALELELAVETFVLDGDEVKEGDVIATINGAPKQISIAEDILIGLIAKTSGIATAARKAVKLSKGKIRIVSGAWKKMPYKIKDEIREAINIGGANIRISDDPFIYLDKNYIRMFGSVKKALEAAKIFENRLKVVQLKGETDQIWREAIEAVYEDVDIIMVDTGKISDLKAVSEKLRDEGVRDSVKLAFGGSIVLEDIPKFLNLDVDILDIGRAIIDAPMLDIRFDVM